MKTVALQCVDNHCCLGGIFEVRKSEVNFEAIFGLSRNETKLLKTREGSEDVGNFSISSILRQSLNVDRTSSIGWNLD